MAVVTFVASGCPMRNALDYVTRDEATERKLVDGIRCSPETAAEEFRFVKERFGKENGRQKHPEKYRAQYSHCKRYDKTNEQDTFAPLRPRRAPFSG